MRAEQPREPRPWRWLAVVGVFVVIAAEEFTFGLHVYGWGFAALGALIVLAAGVLGPGARFRQDLDRVRAGRDT